MIIEPAPSNSRFVYLAAIAAALFGLGFMFFLRLPNDDRFNGERAYADVAAQIAFGPRTPGSEAHAQAVEWMAVELREAGWQVEIQEAERLGHSIRNVIATRGEGEEWILLGAHYDSRFVADHDADPALRQQPVPGANDGASGVAVLLELARVLPEDLDSKVTLVFFDAEDQGNIEGWDWILGSRAYAESLSELPDAMVLLDMIGDADLQIYRESNSDEALTSAIWQQAAALWHEDVFMDSVKFSMLDDHVPFLELGIPAIDIIDFDYPHWHTTQDDLDAVSAESLQIVGEVILAWLLAQ
jgi:glutaminyl-peptide cyclotransferase